MKNLLSKIICCTLCLFMIVTMLSTAACGKKPPVVTPGSSSTQRPGGSSGSGSGDSSTIDPPVFSHICTQKCGVCDGCLDESCQEASCAKKCGGSISDSYTFEAENPANVITPGTRGMMGIATGKHSVKGYDITYLSNFSANIGGGVTYTINAEEDAVVDLRVSVSRCTTGAVVFSNVVTTLINFEDSVESACIIPKSRTNNWFDFGEFNLGCIRLAKGENTIQFISSGTNFNFDYIRIKSAVGLTYANGENADWTGEPPFYPDLIDPDAPDDNELEMYPDVSKVECNDASWTMSQIFDALYCDENTGAYNFAAGLEVSKGCSRQTAENRLNDRGAGAVGSLSGNKGRMVTFYITCDKDCKAALYGEFSYRAKALLFGNALRLIVNDVNLTSSVEMPKGPSYNPTDMFLKVGFIDLKQGTNKITFMVNNKTNDYTPNIYGIRFATDGATLAWGEIPVAE